MKYSTLKARLVKRINQMNGRKSGDFDIDIITDDNDFKMNFNFTVASVKGNEQVDNQDVDLQ
jgi:hypothetical protein